MEGGNSHIQDEMREVEEELEEDSSLHDTQNARGQSIPMEAIEEGKGGDESLSSSYVPPSPSRRLTNSLSGSQRSSSPHHALSRPNISLPPSGRGKTHWTAKLKESTRNTLQLMTNPVFAQAFVLTFLGEWGDRSQITTIAMAGAHVSGGRSPMSREVFELIHLDNRASRSSPLEQSLVTDYVQPELSWVEDISRPKSPSSTVSLSIKTALSFFCHSPLPVPYHNHILLTLWP